MADASVTFLLENLKQVLLYYKDLIANAEGELNQLKRELELLQGFLKEAAKKRFKEEHFKALEREVRKVVYDVEDIIDEYLVQQLDAKPKPTKHRGLSKFIKKASPTGISLAEKVRDLRAKHVQHILGLVQGFSQLEISDDSGNGKQHIKARDKRDDLPRQDMVVGFEDEYERLVGYLKEPKKELDIISIIGMPGLGKTTLAWKIYQDSRVNFEFGAPIWVKVSQDLNRKDVFLNILKAFTREDLSNLNDIELADKVYSHLKTGTFLLFLDDVGSVDDWEAIKNALPMNNSNGKIVITSRYEQVGKKANRHRGPHMLRFLTAKESWQLLQYGAFGDLNSCPSELKGIGEQIAKKTGGLPLTLVVLGGILSDQPLTIEAWNAVAENVREIVVEDDRLNRIDEIVSYSYDKLPYHLRDPFLYLGIFKEDTKIPAWNLITLWIAEGFIQEEEGKSLEDTAKGYLKDLIERNLLMVDKRKFNTEEVKTCLVHDVIREFCKKKASLKEQNLFKEIKMVKGVFNPQVSDIHKYRRLAIHTYVSEFLSEELEGQGPHVRSFMCFSNEAINLPPECNSSIPDAFKLLRVLGVKSIKYNQFPLYVTKLIHLRIIYLSCDTLDVLPEAVSKLWNLQTFIVATKSSTLDIKANLWDMIQLRHFKTKASITLANEGKSEDKENKAPVAKDLQTLTRLSPECCTEAVLKKTPNLKKLGIRGRLATLPDANCLETLIQLEKLELVNDLNYDSDGYKLSRFLERSKFPPNLKSLTLSATSLHWDNMSILSNITNLEELKLRNNAFKGITWSVSGKFAHLKYLLIADTELGNWEVSGDKFPQLTCLVLSNCRQLNEVPRSMAKKLQTLDVRGVNNTSVDNSAMEIEKEKKEEMDKEKTEGQRAGRRVEFKLFMGP